MDPDQYMEIGYDDREVKVFSSSAERKLGIKKMKKHYRKILNGNLENTDHFGRSIFEKYEVKKGKRMD